MLGFFLFIQPVIIYTVPWRGVSFALLNTHIHTHARAYIYTYTYVCACTYIYIFLIRSEGRQSINVIPPSYPVPAGRNMRDSGVYDSESTLESRSQSKKLNGIQLNKAHAIFHRSFGATHSQQIQRTAAFFFFFPSLSPLLSPLFPPPPPLPPPWHLVDRVLDYFTL